LLRFARNDKEALAMTGKHWLAMTGNLSGLDKSDLLSYNGVQMKTEVKRQRRRESGFTLMELIIVFLVVAILAVVLVLLATGVFGGAHKSAMATDLHTVGIAVDDYYLQSLGKSPTVDGSLPPEGQYSLIDFNASFIDGAKTYYFKDLLKKLPRHYNEGVWRIDSKMDVSVDMDPKEY